MSDEELILDHMKRDALSNLWHCTLQLRALHVRAKDLDEYADAIEEIEALKHGVCGIPMMDRCFLECTSYSLTYDDIRGQKRHLYVDEPLWFIDRLELCMGKNKIVMVYDKRYFD